MSAMSARVLSRVLDIMIGIFITRLTIYVGGAWLAHNVYRESGCLQAPQNDRAFTHSRCMCARWLANSPRSDITLFAFFQLCSVSKYLSHVQLANSCKSFSGKKSANFLYQLCDNLAGKLWRISFLLSCTPFGSLCLLFPSANFPANQKSDTL